MKNSKHYQILVVDDVEDIRDCIQEYISDDFFHVDQATDGIDALEKMKKKTYDLIISDFNMPRMSGIDLIKHTRELGFIIPFVFISGYGNKEDLETISQFDAYILIDKLNITQIKSFVEKSLIKTDEENDLKKSVTDADDDLTDFLSILKNVP